MSDNKHFRLLPLLSLSMFAVYVYAVLSLHQGMHIGFATEESGAIAVAVSRRLYGTPWGFCDLGLMRYFWSNIIAPENVPAARLIAHAMNGAATPSHHLWLSDDGDGVGPIVMAEFAFALFGATARALPLFFLLLNGISSICFLARFRDARGAAAALLLFAQTLLLFTPLMQPEWAWQAPVGGIRYYSVVGVLPALHWCLEIGDSGLGSRIPLRWTLLGTQSAILAFAILVRGSPIYLLAPVTICILLALRRGTKLARLRRPVLLPATVVFAGLIVLPSLAYPAYVQTGRLYAVKWHRTLISLGANPAWPFPGLRERYHCPEIPAGIVPGMSDGNGACIIDDYVNKHGLSNKQLYAEATYDYPIWSSAEDQIERYAFFDILLAYPGQVVMTFLYYKPQLAWKSLVATLRPGDAATRPAAAFLLAQLALLIAVAFAVPVVVTTVALPRQLAVIGLFLVTGTVPQFAAWTVPYTMIDLLIYVFCLATVLIFWMAAVFGNGILSSTIRQTRRTPSL